MIYSGTRVSVRIGDMVLTGASWEASVPAPEIDPNDRATAFLLAGARSEAFTVKGEWGPGDADMRSREKRNRDNATK
jgi:hypothetical protein